MLYFVKPTCVTEEERLEILVNVYDFTYFEDIIVGEAKLDTLVDIISVVVDIIEQHTQSPPYRVIVVLRDEKDVDMTITVWESYVAELGASLSKNKIEKQPLILMLTLAKIKLPTSQYLVLINSIMFLF